MLKLCILFFIYIGFSSFAWAGFLPRAFEAEFVEEKKSLLPGKVISKPVVFKYEYPSNIHMNFDSNDTIYICNSKKVWIYQPPIIEGEKGTLKIGTTNKHCYSKLFDSLKRGLKSNKLYSVKKSQGNNYLLSFKKSAREQLSIEKLEIEFEGKKTAFTSIKQFKIFFIEDENPLRLVKKSIKLVKGFSDKIFSFDPPDNTDIQEMK